MNSRIIPQVTADMNTASVHQASNSNQQVSNVFIVPPNSLGIPTAAYRRRMKQTDQPGRPTGTLISARLVFNRLYRENMSGDSSYIEDYPVYPKMANSIKDLIRSHLYQRIGLQRGERTFTSVKIEYASQLMTLKRKIEEKFPILQAAQNHWIATDFIKESMQRDKKAKVEAEKKNRKAKLGVRGQESGGASTGAIVTDSSPQDSGHHHKRQKDGIQQVGNEFHGNGGPKNVSENSQRGTLEQSRHDEHRKSAVGYPEPIQERRDACSKDQAAHDLGRNHDDGTVCQSQKQRMRERRYEDDFGEVSGKASEDWGSSESDASENEREEQQRIAGGLKKTRDNTRQTGRHSIHRFSRIVENETEDSVGSDDISPVPISRGSRKKGPRRRRGSPELLKKTLKKTKRHGFRAPRSRKSLAN